MHITQQCFQTLSLKTGEIHILATCAARWPQQEKLQCKNDLAYHNCWGCTLTVLTQWYVVFCYTLNQEGNKYSTGSSSTTGHMEDANRYFHLLSGGKLQQGGGFPLDTIIACSPHGSLSHTECRKEQMTDGCSVKTTDLLLRNGDCIWFACWKIRGSCYLTETPQPGRQFNSSVQIDWLDRMLHVGKWKIVRRANCIKQEIRQKFFLF